MERIIYFVDDSSKLSCHGSIVDVVRNRSKFPVSIKCSCGEYFHLVVPSLDEPETFIIMSSTKLNEEEVSVLSRFGEGHTIDESILSY